MMPSQSKKQHNFMALVANNPAASKRLKVSQSIGEDFMKADMGKKFKEGGASMKSDLKQDKKIVKKALSMHDKQAHGGKSTDLTKLKHGGMMDKKKMMGMSPMMKKGYAEGGMTMVNKGGKMVPDFAADGVGKMKKGGMATGMHKMPNGKMMKDSAMKKMNMGGMAKGGGIESKGKTKGTMIKMKSGGRTC